MQLDDGDETGVHSVRRYLAETGGCNEEGLFMPEGLKLTKLLCGIFKIVHQGHLLRHAGCFWECTLERGLGERGDGLAKECKSS